MVLGGLAGVLTPGPCPESGFGSEALPIGGLRSRGLWPIPPMPTVMGSPLVFLLEVPPSTQRGPSPSSIPVSAGRGPALPLALPMTSLDLPLGDLWPTPSGGRSCLAAIAPFPNSRWLLPPAARCLCSQFPLTSGRPSLLRSRG